MNLPGCVSQVVEDALGSPVTSAAAVGGGCINQTLRIDTRDGRCFVKWNPRAPAGFFESESHGLQRLRGTDTVRVPEVLAQAIDGSGAAMALAWIDESPASPRAMEDAGRRLALLHRQRGHSPGLDRPGWIGTLEQDNEIGTDGSWLSFFRERRLEPLASALPTAARRDLDKLDLHRYLEEPEGGCCLLHGDLWAGNLVTDRQGRGWVVDPAIYCGHPEMDLAMTRLFGGFSPAFYGAYQDVHGAFDEGLDDRLELWNLYPLLVHAHLFGGGYGSQVASIVGRYA